MHVIFQRLALSTALALASIAIVPAGAQTPVPAVSPDAAATAAPLCPKPPVPLNGGSNVTWTFFAPDQMCRTMIFASGFFGTLTITGVEDGMVAVTPLTGFTKTTAPGTVFTVTSGAKGGQSKFGVHYAGDSSRVMGPSRDLTFTIVNKY